jgi:Heme/copper-type cytochrome/quinol oxidase, subunit 3
MGENRDYYIHPLYILITLVLGSVTALFLGFSVAYVYSRVQNGQSPVQIPVLFLTNSIFLLATSYLLKMTKSAYEGDRTTQYKGLLWGTLCLTLIFLICQIIAWRQMLDMNISLKGSNLGAYLYVISGVHFTHVVAGIPFLAFFIHDARKRLVEPASVLVYLSDPDKKRKLTILTIYWHYLDGLWIYLVLFFLINRWIT